MYVGGMAEHTNIKLRELLESDTVLRQALRVLNSNLGNINTWLRAHREAVRHGYLLSPEFKSKHWSRPTDGYITGVKAPNTLMYAFDAPASRWNHVMFLSRMKDAVRVDIVKIPQSFIDANLIDNYQGL